MSFLKRSFSVAARAIRVLGFMLFFFVLGLDMLYNAVMFSSDKIILSSQRVAEILSVFMAECILFFISFFVFF